MFKHERVPSPFSFVNLLKNKFKLQAHKLRKHTPNTVTCKGCTMVFVNQESHDKHKCKTKEVPCPDCGKMISSRVVRC